MSSDLEQFTLLWTRSQHSVAAYIASLVPDVTDAEDILSEVAVVLVRKFADYDKKRCFAAWAIGIARNHVLKHWQAKGRRPRLVDEHLLDQLTQTHSHMVDEFNDMRLALDHCLQQMNGRRREALALRYGENLKPQAIAGRLGSTAEAVRNLLTRVRQALRECIERQVRKANWSA